MKSSHGLRASGVMDMHDFMKTYGAYPVAVAVILCCGLLGARAVYSRTWHFFNLLWNLFLAFIPYALSTLAHILHRAQPRRWWRVLPLVLLSVAFFPNAPYIVTDFIYLSWDHPPVPQWYDVGMLAVFAWTGIVLGVYALRLMQTILCDWIGVIGGWFFSTIVILLSGLGIYMGRFLRWNSWDLLVQPKAVIFDILERLRDPLTHPGTYGVAIMFSALIFVSYLTLTFGPRVRSRRQDEISDRPQ